MRLPKTFIGYSNFKFLVKELIKMYSNQPSFFSKKRVNEGVAFYSAVITDLYYVWSHMTTIASSEALCHFGGLAALAGYHLNEIQKEKRDLLPPSNDPNPPQP